MKHLKLLLPFIVWMFVWNAVQAQDPKADAVLKASKAKFNSLKDLSGSLTYTLSNPNLDKPIVKNGTIDLSGDKFRVIFKEEEMYCNGEYIWIYLKEDKEVTKTNFDPEEGISVNRLYSIYETNAKSKYEGVEGTLEKITLFATDKSSDFWKSEIWVSKTTKLIEKAKLYGRNGTVYEYKMSSLKTNSGLLPAIFNFNESTPGVYINDLSE